MKYEKYEVVAVQKHYDWAMAVLREHIEVNGLFVADTKLLIRRAAEAALSDEADCRVTFEGIGSDIRLSVQSNDGSMRSTQFDFGDLAIHDLHQDQWWEEAIRSAWRRLSEPMFM